MSEVDLALHDESQQYGNLDETAAIARLPCVNQREQLLKGCGGFLGVGEVVSCQIFIRLCILFQYEGQAFHEGVRQGDRQLEH